MGMGQIYSWRAAEILVRLCSLGWLQQIHQSFQPFQPTNQPINLQPTSNPFRIWTARPIGWLGLCQGGPATAGSQQCGGGAEHQSLRGAGRRGCGSGAWRTKWWTCGRWMDLMLCMGSSMCEKWGFEMIRDDPMMKYCGIKQPSTMDWTKNMGRSTNKTWEFRHKHGNVSYTKQAFGSNQQEVQISKGYLKTAAIIFQPCRLHWLELQTWDDLAMSPGFYEFTQTHTHIYNYIYIYIYHTYTIRSPLNLSACIQTLRSFRPRSLQTFAATPLSTLGAPVGSWEQPRSAFPGWECHPKRSHLHAGAGTWEFVPWHHAKPGRPGAGQDGFGSRQDGHQIDGHGRQGLVGMVWIIPHWEVWYWSYRDLRLEIWKLVCELTMGAQHV